MWRKVHLLAVLLISCTFMLQGGTADAVTAYANCRNVAAFAHRGQDSAKAGVDEDTIGAYIRAAQEHVNGETDVWVAGDHVTPVVMHDRSAKRTTGVNKNITDMSLAEISALRTIPSGNKVPTLAQLVAAMKGTRITIRIEAKGTPAEWNPAAIDKFISILRSNHRLTTYQIYSADPAVLKEFEARQPAVITLWKDSNTFVLTRDLSIMQTDHLNGVIINPANISDNDAQTLARQGYIIGSRKADTSKGWQVIVTRKGFSSVMTDYPVRYKLWCRAQ